MDVKVSTHHSVQDHSTIIVAKFSEMAERYLPQVILEKIAQSIADKYVEEHYGEIAAKLDQNAIANLAIADAGKKIAEEIRQKPTILHDTKTEVYQRGVLGGMRKVR